MPLLGWLCFVALLPALSAYAAIANGLTATSFSLFLTFFAGFTLAGAAGWWLWQQQRARQKAQQKMLQQLLTDTSALVAVLDQNCQLLITSNALERIAVGQNLCDCMYFDPTLKQKAWQDIRRVLEQHRSWQGEVWWQLKDDLLAVSLTITQSNNSAWPAARFLLVAQDITERKRADQQQLNNLLRDPLTNLPNRIMLEEQLATNISCCTQLYPTTALLLVKFNQLLSTEQSASGQSSAKRIAEAARDLRQALAPQYAVGRFNSDSFAVLVPPHLCAMPVDLPLNQLAHQILLQISQFNIISSHSQIYVSIGISRYPEDGADAPAMMQSAERAVQLAARSGTSQFSFADARLQQHSAEYLTLQAELSKSLIQNDFTVYFQPQLSISSNRIVGYEALLRWHNPKRGIMQPQSFLALAEQSGMIVTLDRLVFRQCCQQIKQWLQMNQLRGRIALNISAQHFQQSDFVEYVVKCLDEHKLPAEHFTLELDERVFQQPGTDVQPRLAALNEAGFHLVMDNFGDGTSSLTSLRQLPLHGVKIARSLITQMEQKEQQRNITSSLIRLAGYLQLEVTASGIDNEMQAYLLHVMGCDKLQGNLFSKALPASEIPALLAKENKLIKKTAS
ncbi:bifunctional diguanylate cyclase/phosphodiesterase [Arsukibacterium sp.]|uniref:putative bifunctional diguanylate cyclase/phosphodiesterase n=1 Tax=Arsukibacterium sp. TaxID=1977258 RepID=UPI00299E8DA4|nr:bifunctional diguanylate cyclase/phosphodiesterase [Arsukibacterium sp.]MDX1676673.1 bifunctional diguanylate cyclase/phosphodiesterase [Arsukibacterium sp.]